MMAHLNVSDATVSCFYTAEHIPWETNISKYLTNFFSVDFTRSLRAPFGTPSMPELCCSLLLQIANSSSVVIDGIAVTKLSVSPSCWWNNPAMRHNKKVGQVIREND